MQLHTLLNSILASTQLHDYDHIALFQLLFQILRSHNAGNHHQTLLLFDNMQSGNCSRGDECRYSCCPFHLKTAVNQFVIYILDRRIKARISFCYYHHIPTFSINALHIFVQGIIARQCRFTIPVHRQHEKVDLFRLDVQSLDYICRTGIDFILLSMSRRAVNHIWTQRYKIDCVLHFYSIRLFND